MNIKTNVVKIGDKKIGGKNPILIQSMTNTKTSETKKTISQIHKLEEEGCDLIRVAVDNIESAKAINTIKPKIHIPIIADIHFDYKLALIAIHNGADKVRINPGNIDKEGLKEIVQTSKEYKIPIRIGVNSGSINKDVLKRFKGDKVKSAVFSAKNTLEYFNKKLDFDNIVLSVKSSNVIENIETIRALYKDSKKTYPPLHLGLTEAGIEEDATIKSATLLAPLLLEEIGNTIRVSITGDPIKEIRCAKKILSAINKRKEDIEVISCPTCGRCKVNLEKVVLDFKSKMKNIKTNKKIKVAIMGCVVNGIGEAGDANMGLCFIGKDEAMFFKNGKRVKTINSQDAVNFLISTIK